MKKSHLSYLFCKNTFANSLWSGIEKNIIDCPMSEGMSARAKRLVRSEQTSERWERVEEQVAQYLHLGSWLFWTTVHFC